MKQRLIISVTSYNIVNHSSPITSHPMRALQIPPTPKAILILHTPADYDLPRASVTDAFSSLSPASTSWMGSHLLCIALLPANTKREKDDQRPVQLDEPLCTSWMGQATRCKRERSAHAH